MTAMEMIIEIPPCDWERIVDRMPMNERQTLGRHCDSIAKHATMMGTYLEMREGFGCGDQGHHDAVKAANKAGKKVWCDVLGYNEFVSVRI